MLNPLKNANDEIYMAKAIRLAGRGLGRTSPNPAVGAVVVNDGIVVGEGYHLRAGGDHAEVVALKKAGQHAKGGVLYCNLEPCCHYGRTPPCTQRIIESGIKRVVMAMLDPNSLVSGKGQQELEAAGIEISVGMLKKEAERLNEVYIKFITTGLPFVILKMAISLDGRIVDPTASFLSGREALHWVHRLRNRVDAILVGKGTILRDDPQLTARLESVRGRDPVRIVVDARAEVPPEAAVFNPESAAETIIVIGKYAPDQRVLAIEKAGGKILRIEGNQGRIDLASLLAELGRLEITSLLVEGGTRIATSFLRDKLVDRALFILSPKIMGRGDLPGVIGEKGLLSPVKLKEVSYRRLGADVLVSGYITS